jgi:very-short-patch-repair endonuclease
MENYKLIIECDGAQHFRAIYCWKDPKLTQERDKYKMKCANEHGYSVIRIYQEDVWNNKNNWEENLKSAIKKYDIPTNVYIGNVYEGIYFNCNAQVLDVI